MLPFVEVSHLPSSSSFYSTVTQPLGLRYISTPNSGLSLSSSPSITYGLATSPPTPVFEIRQVKPTAERPLKLSRVIFSAASPRVVGRFEQKVKEADGRALLDDNRSVASLFSGPGALEFAEDWRLAAKTIETDLDGNTMEVVYIPPPTYPEGYSGSTIRKTSSSEGEISRIMTWNYDVAATTGAPPVIASPMVSRRSHSYAEDDAMPIIRRTVTTTSTTYLPAEPAISSAPSTGSIVGTLLGVAAASAAIGAGVAYGAMKHERLRGDIDPPSFQRRSTFPEPLGHRVQYSEYGPPRGDYHSVTDRRPPPTLLTRYPHSQSPRDGGDSSYDDTRSRRSSRAKGASSTRTRSELSSGRKPLLLTEAEHRSYISSSSARTSEMLGGDDAVVLPRAEASSRAMSGAARSSSKYSDAAAMATPGMRRSRTYDDDRDRDSYVSSRSRRTASTVRGPSVMQPTAQTEYTTTLVSRPKMSTTMPGAASRASRRADSYASAREMPASGTEVSARRIRLPMSGVGSSQAGYAVDDDDMCSIAPSESISCMGGSRKGSRVYI